MKRNYWTEIEYNKLKLLNKIDKVNSILGVLSKNQEVDLMPPISIELHLTDNCNLNCHWCTDGILRKNLATLDKNIVFKLFDYCSENNIGVTIEGGGEPSIHKDFSDIVAYGYDKGLHMGLITNGVKDFSKISYMFKWIRISLDSSNKEQYKIEKGFDRFDKVLENIQKINMVRDASQTHLGIGYVLTTRNIDEIEILTISLNKLGVDYMYLRPVEEAQDICPTLDILYDLKIRLLKILEAKRLKFILNTNERLIKDNFRLPCIAHSLTCIINANGNVALCEKRRHEPLILGNLNSHSFDEIWKGERRITFSKKLLSPKEQVGCDVCRITSFNTMFAEITNINTKNFI